MSDIAAATFLLLVTWFSPAGVSSYQREFADLAKCQRAAAVLYGEQSRLQQGLVASLDAGAVQVQSGTQLDQSRPIVTAICVAR